MAAAEVAAPELRRDRRLVCVEYPGVVQDVAKTLQTLGGEEGVSRVRRGGRAFGAQQPLLLYVALAFPRLL